MKIGVFDSGVGGLSVANSLETAFPDQTIILRQDPEHVPYATRDPEEIFGFVVPIFEDLVKEGCSVIVVACNTVSTTLIDRLRARFEVRLIAVEPMVEKACLQTKTKVIAVCATPTTLASKRYHELIEMYGKGVKVLEPNCIDWSAMIEHNQIDDEKITARISEVIGENADVIVLGCTHYHWIEDRIKQLATTKAVVLQPEPDIINELKAILERLA